MFEKKQPFKKTPRPEVVRSRASGASKPVRPARSARVARADGRATRERVLKAAAVEFAACGFRGASVRRICGKAGANIASVKYYFGDKARLYKAAIDHAADRALGSQPPPPMRHEFRSAREALEAWVRWGVAFSIRRYREHTPLSKIILREMREPTPVFDVLVRERAQPVHAILLGIVAELLGERLGPGGVRRVSGCVLAICAQFEHSAELFARLGFPPPQNGREIREVIEIVVGFVMGGVQNLIDSERGQRGVLPRKQRSTP